MAVCRNVGSADRAVRGVIGVAALALAFTALRATDGNLTGLVVATVGAVLLSTALLGMCPLYLPFRVSTCRVK